MATCNCCNDCCPEVVAVTVNNNTYSIDGAAITITVADQDPVVGTGKDITVQVDAAGYWRLNCWFQDGSTIGAEVSVQPPDDPGISAFQKITDSLGKSEFEVNFSGAQRVWYLCATLGAGVVISDPIIIGT